MDMGFIKLFPGFHCSKCNAKPAWHWPESILAVPPVRAVAKGRDTLTYSGWRLSGNSLWSHPTH